MRRAWFLVLAAVVSFAVVLGTARPARAENAGVGVLPVDSEDAEDQAEALTTAVRAKVKDQPGLRLAETSQSLGMLTTALKCSRVPDATCQAKIADQLKLDRFVWGTMSKSAGSQVTVELHLFQRGKADTAIRESYSDNLKDQNDDNLRRVAQRLLDRLFGRATGVVVVRTTPPVTGEVVVDGKHRAALSGGAGRVEAPFGAHGVEISAKGYQSAKREVTIPPGGEVAVDVTLAAKPDEAPRAAVDSKGLPIRKIAGFGSIGLGVAAGVVSGVFTAQWLDLNSKQQALIDRSPNGLDVCSTEAKAQTQNGGGDAEVACKADKDAKTKSIVAFAAGGAAVVGIGVGAFLLLTDKSGEEAAPPKAGKIRAIPAVGPQGGSLTLTGAF